MLYINMNYYLGFERPKESCYSILAEWCVVQEENAASLASFTSAHHLWGE